MKFSSIISLQNVFMLVGMTVWLSMTIIPSSAETVTVENPTGIPICWAKIDKCQKAETGSELLAFAAFSPTCCPELKEQMKDTKCFCSIKSYILGIPSVTPSYIMSATIDSSVNSMLFVCNIDGSFQDICKGAESGSNKIASFGILPVSALIWTMM